jgi:hypothetical protein
MHPPHLILVPIQPQHQVLLYLPETSRLYLLNIPAHLCHLLSLHFQSIQVQIQQPSWKIVIPLLNVELMATWLYFVSTVMCVLKEDVQDMLTSGLGQCGLCPRPLSAMPVTSAPVTPTAKPMSRLTAMPSSVPSITILQEDCKPVIGCGFHNKSVVMCIFINDQEGFSSCVPQNVVEDVLDSNLLNRCGLCPSTSEPTTPPSDVPPTPFPSIDPLTGCFPIISCGGEGSSSV